MKTWLWSLTALLSSALALAACGAGGCGGETANATANAEESFKGMNCGEGTLFDPKSNSCVKVAK